MYKYIILALGLVSILSINVMTNYKSYVQASSTEQVGYTCGWGRISIGDSSVDLITSCGKPNDIAMRIAPYGTGTVQVWVYLNRHMLRDNAVVYFSINTLDKISHIKVIR